MSLEISLTPCFCVFPIAGDAITRPVTQIESWLFLGHVLHLEIIIHLGHFFCVITLKETPKPILNKKLTRKEPVLPKKSRFALFFTSKRRNFFNQKLGKQR